MNNKAFTLIEVLVVVLIIGVLTSIALPQYQKAVIKSRLSHAMTIAGIIRDAEHVYHDTFNAYTTDLAELDVSLPGCQQQSSASSPMRKTKTYLCDGGWRIQTFLDYDVASSAEIRVPPDYKIGIEYFFHNDIKLCYVPGGETSLIAICTSMGGTPYSSGKYFQLP